jgi:hypothetical protein
MKFEVLRKQLLGESLAESELRLIFDLFDLITLELLDVELNLAVKLSPLLLLSVVNRQ